ncbi:PREDICTED: melanoma antigen preferentially expressed in tumors-like [Elephantulus edwardii]|uniref:melanoma antigen preferentially expressed in tumors-like n=1 Tax=Elephantulus edwardii TaxID=28737 RepID=UPI0003F07DF2|nr:PREDICTED: melanoma antigen preferentially expressed in tumors-like [Elephantulus edwardii]
MNSCGPARLLDLANQSLLRNETWNIAALEWLPTELFPPLFMAAVTGRHSHMLKAMVQAWPFSCLPLGVLIKAQHSCREILQRALDGLDVLVAQKTYHRRSKLKMLDLREKEASLDEWSAFLIQGVPQRKGLLHLSHTKLKIVAIPLRSVEEMLKMAHL